MSIVSIAAHSQQWLSLGNPESAILDAMLAWAKAITKTNPERIQVTVDGDNYIVSGGEYSFHVQRFDGDLPGIGWGSMDYWAAKAGQDSDWRLLFDDGRGTVLEEVYWATSKLHGINTAHGLAPDATKGYPNQNAEDLWRVIGIPEYMRPV